MKKNILITFLILIWGCTTDSKNSENIDNNQNLFETGSSYNEAHKLIKREDIDE